MELKRYPTTEINVYEKRSCFLFVLQALQTRMFSVRNVALRRTQIYAHLPSRVNRSQTARCWVASRIRATAVKIMCAMIQSLLLSSQVRVCSLVAVPVVVSLI